MKKIAMVVQRYGDDIIGGAESLVKQISENLSEHRHWNIDIYTTTAKDYQTWKNSFPSGCEKKGPIQVKRFPTKIKRNRLFFGAFNFIFSTTLKYLGSRNLIGPLDYFRMKIENLWFILQGPYCPELVSSLTTHAHKYECIYFYTYLYYPCVHGQKKLNSKSILVPFAHDEKPLYFKTIADNFERAKQILVNCEAEKSLILSTFNVDARKISQAGVGLDETISQPKYPNNKLGNEKSNEPYLLFMGRVCKAKGIDKLVRYFEEYKRVSGDLHLSLVIAGQIDPDFNLASQPAITFLGRVSEERKIDLINSCLAVVNPSDFESLSMLVLEAICCRKPVMVNGSNLVLNSYTEKTRTAFSFVDASSFRTSLEHIKTHISDSDTMDEDLNASVAWVLENYSWDRVMSAYENSMRAIVETDRNQIN